MKTYLFCTLLLAFPVGLVAQTINSQDEKLIDEYLHKNLTSAKTQIGSAAVSKVFVGTFYLVDPAFNTDEGLSYVMELPMNINSGEIVLYELLSTDKELPALKSLVKKDFLLKDESKAKLFEAALNELYPVKESEMTDVKHLKKINQWIFLRAKFFDDQTAVIVTTEPNGTITKMEVKLGYSLK
jgi:hypothetical protein